MIYDYLFFVFKYVPLIAGAYITIIMLKIPDLTIEVSWSLSAIVGCMLTEIVPSFIAPFSGILIGGLSGLLTGVIFVVIGKKKLLAALISYTVQIAIGYHLLGTRANIFTNITKTKFGFPDGNISLIIYMLIAAVVVIFVRYWEKGRDGIITRMIGENPYSSIFYKISLNSTFVKGFVIANAIVGFGGATWGVFYGYASNTQGIGLVFTVFLALLIGEELIHIFKLSKRSSYLSVIIGSMIFVMFNQFNEWLINTIQLVGINIKTTDKNIFMAIFLLIVIGFRRSKTMKGRIVSEW